MKTEDWINLEINKKRKFRFDLDIHRSSVERSSDYLKNPRIFYPFEIKIKIDSSMFLVFNLWTGLYFLPIENKFKGNTAGVRSKFRAKYAAKGSTDAPPTTNS